ncbi:NACHT and WD40 domain protein [Aspergillus bombycis]|uniref:NACHT and WD40 domain protein n=1 Tax=Aspergillus bombycis TaxID=109264 RepID=A0A1F7ZTK1_9EURO|nr:NACHT and WD40 domain protein [Aspergillus bombycis]OGM42784.1 NACHT and WD40 domain protein [Aspergillus bombycis]
MRLKTWGKDLKSRLRPKAPSVPSPSPAIAIRQHSGNQAQDHPHPQDLWQSAYDQLDRKEQLTLSTCELIPSEIRSNLNGRSPTEAIIEGVIHRTKQQYEEYQNGSLKIRRSTGEDIDLRQLSRNIIDAALSFKDVVSAVVAYDPTQYAASAWAVVSLGLTMTKNRFDLRDTLFDSTEYLANVLARCAYIEKGIYHNDAWKNAEVARAIIGVYKAILHYAAEVLSAQQPSMGRWIQDTVTGITKQRLADLQSSVKEEEHYLHQWVQMDQHLRHNEQAELLISQCDKMIESVQTLIQRFSLPIAEGAFYDSYDSQHEDKCLPETRTEIRRQITEWVARPTANSFKEKGLLGASFFFKKGEAERGNAKRLISTVAKQLITSTRQLAPGIMAAIQSDPHISSKALPEQFDKLLLQPLVNLRLDEPTSTVVMIDALDECEEEDIKLLLDLLPQVHQSESLRVRIFLTSRPELPIRLGFQQVLEHQDLVLHELPTTVIERDIRLFLQDRLRKIQMEHSLSPGWPGEDIMEILVSRSVPLFSFAATMCRFIGEKYQVPEDRLDAVLNDSASTSGSQMERIYLPILNKLHTEMQATNFTQEIQEVLGVIILLAAPLSVKALAGLVNTPERRIRSRLAAFHSVLRVPSSCGTPVRTLHLSFQEFLLNTTSIFHVNEKESHQKIALYCLSTMNSSLKHNICGLPSYGTQRAKIDCQIINKCLPAELQYSCRYWAYHIKQGKDQVHHTAVFAFLKRHFLHWLEAMSLMGLISEVVNIINTLRLAAQTDRHSELSLFLQDAKLFVLKVIYICNDFPLQLYCSGLAFWPTCSIIKKVFEESQRWVYILPQVEGSSSAELQALKGHSDRIHSEAFPLNDQMISSGSKDNIVKPSDHSNCIVSVTFSPDGRMVASGSKDNTIKLWDPKTGQQLHILDGHSDSVVSVVFSHDSQIVASGSYDRTVKLWDIKSCQQLRTLDGHSDSVVSVAFSPDSQMIASGSDDSTIQLWDTKTGQKLRTLEGHSDWVQSVAFSPDGQIVASGSYDNTIKLWDTKTGQQLRTLEGHSNLVASVVFSPNGYTIASGSYDNTIKLWETRTGQQLHTLEGHSGLVRSVAFLPDSRIVASGSYDSTIKLWDTKTGQQLRTLEGHSGPVRAVALSPDSQIIASGSYDNTIKLWETETGRQLRTLEGDSRPVVLTPDIQLAEPSSLLSVEDGWVTFAAEKVLWLTFDHQQFSSSVAKENTLALAYPDGRVCSMEFRAPAV